MASAYLNHIDCELIAFEMAHGCIMKIVDRRRNRERTKRNKPLALSRPPVLEGSMQTFNKSTFNHELNRIGRGSRTIRPLLLFRNSRPSSLVPVANVLSVSNLNFSCFARLETGIHLNTPCLEWKG